MIYIENIFVCLVSPILIALFFLRGRSRKNLLFLAGGMLSCLLSSYISTFMTLILGADRTVAAIEVTPAVEEMMKLFPVLFYLLVFEPRKEDMAESLLMDALGFATFENVCYLSVNGYTEFFHLLIRGFGTGTMHVVCGAMVGVGLLLLWDRPWLRVLGTVGLFCAAVTYHAIYNLLVSCEGIPMLTGFMIPVFTTVLVAVFGRDLMRRLLPE